MTLPKEPIPGKLKISRHHKKFVYTKVVGLEGTFDDVTKQLNKISSSSTGGSLGTFTAPTVTQSLKKWSRVPEKES